MQEFKDRTSSEARNLPMARKSIGKCFINVYVSPTSRTARRMQGKNKKKNLPPVINELDKFKNK
jgi:hypothetical protein